MALKFKITKSAFGKLSEDMQKEYSEDDDGKGYTLDVSGLPEPEDTGELKRARDREKEKADNLQEELDEVTGKLTTLEAGQGKGEKDIARVTARYEKKLTDQANSYNATIDGLKDQIGSSLKTAAATTLANKISTVPALMQKEINSRLTVEFDADNNPTLKVLKDGKPSEVSVDDLGKELVANKDFASIILGSKAKGGGADLTTKVPPGGSAHAEKPTDLTKMDAASFTDHIREVQQAQQSQT